MLDMHMIHRHTSSGIIIVCNRSFDTDLIDMMHQRAKTQSESRLIAMAATKADQRRLPES